MTSFFYTPSLPSLKLYCRRCLFTVRPESEIIYFSVIFKAFQKKLIIINKLYSLLPCGLWIMKQKFKRWVVYDFSHYFYRALFESPKPQQIPTLSRSVQITSFFRIRSHALCNSCQYRHICFQKLVLSNANFHLDYVFLIDFHFYFSLMSFFQDFNCFPLFLCFTIHFNSNLLCVYVCVLCSVCAQLFLKSLGASNKNREQKCIFKTWYMVQQIKWNKE